MTKMSPADAKIVAKNIKKISVDAKLNDFLQKTEIILFQLLNANLEFSSKFFKCKTRDRNRFIAMK